MKTLTIDRLSISFSKTLFQEVSLEIEENDFVTIMGENGAGKTTLIDCLLGRLPIKQGSIQFFGKQISNWQWDELNSKVGWVLSDWEAFPALLSVDHFLSALRKLYPQWDMSLEKSMLSAFKLKRDSKLNHLSLGERAKLKLVRALSMKPTLLILDELTSNLSPPSREEVTRTLIDLLADRKISVLYACHNYDEAVRLSTRVFELTERGLVQMKESAL